MIDDSYIEEVPAAPAPTPTPGRAVVTRGPRWLSPVVVLLCVLTLCSVPAVVVWFVRETAEVSQAGKSPYAAAYGVLSSLDRWQPEDLAGKERYVMPQRWDDIAALLVEMRRQFGATGDNYVA